MSQNRMSGAGHEAKGAIKEAAGKMVGNRRVQAEGAAEKIAGRAQKTLGKAQDKTAKAIKRH